MAKPKKWLSIGLGLIGLLVIASGLGYRGWLQSLPLLDGEFRLAGLSSPASVDTDAYGIPLINANNRIDAARVLGYVTARDRLFQMDLMRRKSAGRLAEIFGEMALKSDIQSRIYGFNVKARQILSKQSAIHRQYLEAYAEGVNSYLRQNPALPFEFKVLGYRPEPWQAEDCLLVVLGMFENLTAWVERSERMLSIMERTLPPEVLAFLTPDSDRFTDDLMKFAKSLRPPQGIPAAAMQTLLAGGAPDSKSLAKAPEETLAGSNAWAVSGGKTSDGRAILANDMHLGISVPNIWYRVELQYSAVRAAGLNLPGTPFLISGSNRHIAWGITNLSGDFLDLVKLEINPDNAQQYRLGDRWQNFDERHETIPIKGSEPKALTVRETQWGPVAEQPLLEQPVAIHWVALDADAVNVGIMDLEESKTLEASLAIVKRGGGPQLNVLLADEHGHIAWTLTGKIPRRFGGDGAISRSWADGKTGWQGYIQPDEMPQSIDPAEGFLVSANDRRFAADFPYVIGHQYANGYRAYRINQRLKQAAVHSEWSLFNLQQDTRTEFYDYYQQLALKALSPDVLAQKPELIALRNYLISWNGRADIASLGLPILVEFRKQLIDSVFTPFLNACRQVDKDFVYHWNYVDTPLQALLNEKPAQLLPDAAHHKTWKQFILAQLETGAAAVMSRHPDVGLADLTWGKQNIVGHAHPFSKALPLLSPALDMPHQPLAGCGGFCVRVTGADFGASERLVVSPNHLSEGILHMPGGQSGHPLSSYYKDQQAFWVEGLPMSLLTGKSRHKLVLRPE
ncbi:penicillin acylase family protein [Methylomicrobium sp. RS1]|uniref:penicillin acylase family protein n=1 Tax=Candidatus Methylomicrobium oryzae TaxID=2802053 RepID=UPI001922B498|nr:penicillin acylase family protein [Methylomicrobium sp. RS1]MBL1264301.1 penicillin acylase family protein [Methylomicrobium sp. RS1]